MDRRLRTGLSSLALAGLLIVSGCLGGFGGTMSTLETERTASYDPPDFDHLDVDRGTLFVNRTFANDEAREMTCNEAMKHGVLAHLHRRTREPPHGIRVHHEGVERLVVVQETTLDRNGNVETEPAISYDRTVDILPNRTVATLTVDNSSYSCSADIEITNRTLHLD